MVDLSRIGRNIDAENIAAAFSGTQKTDEIKKKDTKKVRPIDKKGLGLEDIPHTPNYVDVDQVEETEAAAPEEAVNILDHIDTELEQLQDLIKDVLAKKIKLADKHEDRRHELLLSAFNDCKNAYQKIQEVRGNITA